MNSYSENFAKGLTEDILQPDIRWWCLTADRAWQCLCGVTDSQHGVGELSNWVRSRSGLLQPAQGFCK